MYYEFIPLSSHLSGIYHALVSSRDKVSLDAHLEMVPSTETG